MVHTVKRTCMLMSSVSPPPPTASHRLLQPPTAPTASHSLHHSDAPPRPHPTCSFPFPSMTCATGYTTAVKTVPLTRYLVPLNATRVIHPSPIQYSTSTHPLLIIYSSSTRPSTRPSSQDVASRPPPGPRGSPYSRWCSLALRNVRWRCIGGRTSGRNLSRN